MKIYFYIIIILLAFGCETTQQDYPLSTEKLSFVPYKGDEILTFISNKNDTIVYKGIGLASIKEIKEHEKGSMFHEYNKVYQYKDWVFKTNYGKSIFIGLRYEYFMIDYFYNIQNWSGSILYENSNIYKDKLLFYNKLYQNIFCISFKNSNTNKEIIIDTLIYSKSLGILSFSTTDTTYWNIML